jgi:transposase
MPGIGHVRAVGLVAEIGDIHWFDNEVSLAKFTGLTWRKHQSG